MGLISNDCHSGHTGYHFRGCKTALSGIQDNLSPPSVFIEEGLIFKNADGKVANIPLAQANRIYKKIKAQ
jgi:hypothetical protein